MFHEYFMILNKEKIGKICKKLLIKATKRCSLQNVEVNDKDLKKGNELLDLFLSWSFTIAMKAMCNFHLMYLTHLISLIR
jgi:hypothetical protein